MFRSAVLVPVACAMFAGILGGCSSKTSGTDLTPNDGVTNPGTDGGTPSTGPGSDPGTDPTGAPIGLTATAIGPNEIDVCWRPVPTTGATYRLYRDGSSIVTTGETCFEDKSVAAETTYSYSVSAITGGTESPRSVIAAATTRAANQPGDVTTGSLRSATTQQSIGLEWDLSGDSNHNATAEVRYRAAGSPVWKQALNLMRVDFAGQNMLAGSILFLQPATTYDVVLYMTDPDGGTTTKTLQATTRAFPAIPTGGRTLHVSPGSGGGDGTANSPFKGVAAADAAAQPGDVILLHAGNYGGRISFRSEGEAGNMIAWKAAGDGDPVFAGIEVAGSHTYFEGLRITAGGGYDFPIGVRTANAPSDVAVVRCYITGNHYSIWLTSGGSDWYVADNTIVGDNVVSSGDFSGEGIEFQHTNGHVAAYNHISFTGDGMSYCDRNCDLYGNDIHDTSDDGIETDGAYANIRIWGNRLLNTGHNGVSFQPMAGAPWYVIRNLIIGQSESPLKFRGSDHFVLLHNTMVEWSSVQTIWGYEMLNAYSRNNVWVSLKGGAIWNTGDSTPTWMTNLDYDGFDWGGTSSPFKMSGSSYSTVAALASGEGQEEHGVTLSRSCFPTLNVPSAPPASVPSQDVTLAQGCAAIDSGELLPNVNEDFVGEAPDLGAYEFGAPLPHYGPR